MYLLNPLSTFGINFPPLFTDFECSVLLDVAAEVFDSANELSELGLTEQSLPLYENVSVYGTHKFVFNIYQRWCKN